MFQLQGLAGVKAVRSSSEFNFSMITVIFDESVDFYFARVRVLEKLGEVSGGNILPPGVVPRVFNRVIHEVVSRVVIVQVGPCVQEGVRPSCFSSGGRVGLPQST